MYLYNQLFILYHGICDVRMQGCAQRGPYRRRARPHRRRPSLVRGRAQGPVRSHTLLPGRRAHEALPAGVP